MVRRGRLGRIHRHRHIGALDVTLTDDELAQLDPLASQVVGGRYNG